MTADRHLDAVVNRIAEGLRTLEDVARFQFDDRELSARLRELRHQVRQAAPATLIDARDTPGDVAALAPTPTPRGGLVDVVRANAARVQEGGRSLAEQAAAAGLPALAAAGEAVRYHAYTLESRLLARIPAWRLWGVRLYVLVDTSLCADPTAVAAAAARGGAGAVQLRAKGLGVRAYRDLAARVRDAVAGRGCLFVVNDHAAVARALDADGLHVGQDDLDPADARRVVGPRCALGVSCHTAEQVDAAQVGPADYLGLGPMFATGTKPHEPERGPGLLDAVRDRLRHPSYAIGGLDGERIRTLRPRLPHGVAVAGAVCRAADPERAAADLAAVVADPEP